MREREQPDAGELRHLGCLRGRRVHRLARAAALVLGERRLVDEDVGAVRCLDDVWRGRGVAGQREFPPRPSRTEHRVRGDDRAVGQRQRLARLEHPALPAGGHAERVGRGDVEAARPLVLDERVAERADTVLDGERLDHILTALEPLARRQLDERERVRQPPEERTQRSEEVADPKRPVHGQRQLVAAAQREGLEHPRQAEEVVGVEVGEEDLLEVDEPAGRALQLPLRPLGAVEEQPLAAAADEQRCGRALRGRHRGRRPEEDDVKIHGAR